MTNHWNDIKNSDCIIIVGSNAAENHPISFKWVTKAIEENGATLISIDPRFTRSSAKAHIYARMRSGTDIAFFGGMIKWVLDDMEANPDMYNMTYVTEYTNAAFLIDPEFKTAAELDGKFSGFVPGDDPDFGKYDKATWKWQTDADGIPLKDKTLQDPNCVFQLLKKQYARYDPDTVCNITGTDKDIFLKICETYARMTGPVGKTGTIMYAMGTTQHTHGTQNIRSYAILQLLLGNIGVAGGGINALRGESNVQGSTDHCLLFHILPGYLKPPVATDVTLQDHLDAELAPIANRPQERQLVAELSQVLCQPAQELVRRQCHRRPTTLATSGCPSSTPAPTTPTSPSSRPWQAGDIKGLFCWGQNPAVGGPNAFAERKALQNLDWLVSVDLWETETCAFWQEPGVDPGQHPDRSLPAAGGRSYEKEGSVVNSGRWSQWRWKAVDPPGDAMPDLEIVTELMLKVIELYEAEGGPVADAITKLRWKGWYDATRCHEGADEPDRPGLPRDQRLGRGADPQRGWLGTVRGGPAHGLLWPPAGRRLHLLLQLALHPVLQREGRQPPEVARQHRLPPRGHRPLLQVVLVLAGQPAHHLQPRLGGPGRQPVGPGGLCHPLDRAGDQVGRRRARRRLAAHEHGGHALSLHHEAGGLCPHLWAGPGRWAVPRAL